MRGDEPPAGPVLLPQNDAAVRDDRRASRPHDRRAAVQRQDVLLSRPRARALHHGGARRGRTGEVRVRVREPEVDHDGSAVRTERPADAGVAGRRPRGGVQATRARPEPEPEVVHAGRPRRRDLDRKHEHGARRQQEAVSEQRRDHRDAGAHEHDLRSRGPGRGVPRHRLAVRDGLRPTLAARLAAGVLVLARHAPADAERAAEGADHRNVRLARPAVPSHRDEDVQAAAADARDQPRAIAHASLRVSARRVPRRRESRGDEQAPAGGVARLAVLVRARVVHRRERGPGGQGEVRRDASTAPRGRRPRGAEDLDDRGAAQSHEAHSGRERRDGVRLRV
mmetsp:Transcript_13850/g.49706  ORF Transcript_13850/g.49706 Transcript_13850/m.49706 type:complete len:338 (-) Transcript_13850:776-1789(-)